MEYVEQIIKDRECNSYEETKRKASNREERIIDTNRTRDKREIVIH